MPKKVFISYSSKDGKTAASICSALEARGHRCWMSSRDVRPGENFQGAIVRAIRDAGVMVLVFSSNANNSDEIKKEMALASQSHLMVIPVRAEDVLPSEDFTYELATRQWIDMFNDWEHAIEQLGQQIDLAMPREEGAAGSPSSATPKKSRVPHFAGIAAILLATGAGAFWLMRPPPPPSPREQPPQRVAVQLPQPPPPAMDPAKLESDLWDSVKDSGDPAALQSYLAKYPNGIFAAAAKAKLAALRRSAAAPVKTTKVPSPAPPTILPVPPKSEAAPAAAVQASASEPAQNVPSGGLNPQVQEAVTRARQVEQHARTLAETAEGIARQAQDGEPGFGFAAGRGASRWAGRLAAERTGGLGVITYANGDRYAGGTRDGGRFGLGVYTGAPTSIFRELVGQFVAGKLNGYGVAYRRDGKVRIGQWKDGIMNGYGALFDANNLVVEQGLHANGKLATPMKGN